MELTVMIAALSSEEPPFAPARRVRSDRATAARQKCHATKGIQRIVNRIKSNQFANLWSIKMHQNILQQELLDRISKAILYT
jgi:hypothetical protein